MRIKELIFKGVKVPVQNIAGYSIADALVLIGGRYVEDGKYLHLVLKDSTTIRDVIRSTDANWGATLKFLNTLSEENEQQN